MAAQLAQTAFRSRSLFSILMTVLLFSQCMAQATTSTENADDGPFYTTLDFWFWFSVIGTFIGAVAYFLYLDKLFGWNDDSDGSGVAEPMIIGH
jgi:hypothetical protein